MTGLRTHACPNGHPYTPENLLPPNASGRKCRICASENGKRAYHRKGPEYARQRAAQFRANNPDYWAEWWRKNSRKARDRRIMRLYGLSAEDFLVLLESQDGACAICREVLDAPRVDHDHQTGAVRGLLCHNCNIAIGMLRDKPELLERALSYLRGRS